MGPFVVFCVALFVRVLSIVELRSFALSTVPLGDAAAYLEWAAAIAEGDWLSRSVGVFYQAPLYPYFLALVAKIAGPDLLWPRLIQAICGSLTAALLVIAGRRFFGRPTGLVAGLMMALYAPAIFFDGLIGKTSLVIFAMAVFLAVAGRLVHRPTTIGWLTSGLVLGAASLLRENSLLLVAAVFVWLLASGARARSPKRAAWAAIFVVGVLLVLAPVGVRNLLVGGEFKLTTAQGGPNFFIGNNPDADGTYAPLVTGRANARFERADAVRLAEIAAGRELSPGEVSRYWYGRSLDFIASKPVRWLQLSAWKIYLVFHRFEIPDTDDLVLSRNFSRVLEILGSFSHFGIPVPLGVFGIVLSWNRRRELEIPYLMLVVGATGVAAFFVFARYRAPLIPVVVLLAASGIVTLVGAFRHRRRPDRLAIAAVAAAVTVVVVNLPISLGSEARRGMSYSNLGAALIAQGNVDEAVEMYRVALSLDPGLTEAHLNLGSTLLNTGRAKEAVDHLVIACNRVPEDPEIRHQLGTALLMTGDPVGATIHLERAIDLEPRFPKATLALAMAHGQVGRWADAVQVLERGLGQDPDSRTVLVQLIKVLLAAPDEDVRDPDRAVVLSEAMVAGSESGDLEAGRLLVMSYEVSGRTVDAVRAAGRLAEQARRGGQSDVAAEIARWVAEIEARTPGAQRSR